MLKGQLDIDIEFMGGTIVFIALALIMFIEILLPLLAMDYNMVTSEEEIRIVEFANLAKARFAELLGNGNGDIAYEKLEKQVGKGLAGVGLADNYLLIEDLRTGKSFEFPGTKGKTKHDVYSTISSSYKAVMSESLVVMEGGEEYIVHIYKIKDEGDISLDIYQDCVCSQDGPGTDGTGKYKTLGCDDISDLELVEKGVVTHVMGKATNARYRDISQVARVKPENDITAGDLVITGMSLGKTWGCTESPGEHLCVRLMGDFVLPARIHVELGKGGELVTEKAPSPNIGS